MLKKIFGSKAPRLSRLSTPVGGVKAIEGSSSAELAARLLRTRSALQQLSMEEARVVVSFMRPKRISEGVTFIRESDKRNTGFMLLVLEGEVTVESIVVSRTAPVTVRVLGPGSLIGEMGLIDGLPRTASCTATSPIHAAVLTRSALEKLLRDNPPVAAKLLLAISLRLAERMRDTSEKLKMYTQLTQAMQQELARN